MEMRRLLQHQKILFLVAVIGQVAQEEEISKVLWIGAMILSGPDQHQAIGCGLCLSSQMHPLCWSFHMDPSQQFVSWAAARISGNVLCGMSWSSSTLSSLFL